MGIPTITPYPMPEEADVPRAAAGWTPDPRRAVLLIHDMQRYFVDCFPPGRSPVTELLANVGALRRLADRLAMPVVYTAQPPMTPRERGLLLDIWGAGMGADERLGAIVPEAGHRFGDQVSRKYRYSAFHRSGLGRIIADYRRDQLIVCGVFAHIGCLMTACDAYSRDFQTFFVADAVADFTAEYHRLALDYVARLCGVVLTTQACTARLSQVTGANGGRPAA